MCNGENSKYLMISRILLGIMEHLLDQPTQEGEQLSLKDLLLHQLDPSALWVWIGWMLFLHFSEYRLVWKPKNSK